MKAIIPVSLLAATLLLGGCNSPQPGQPAGKGVPVPTRSERWKSCGWLQVYSVQGWDRPARGPRAYVHGGYKILTPAGHLFLKVENIGPLDEPAVVRMEPGSYVVEAPAFNSGTVSIPVRIKTGRTTVLHLDQEDSRDIPKR